MIYFLVYDCVMCIKQKQNISKQKTKTNSCLGYILFYFFNIILGIGTRQIVYVNYLIVRNIFDLKLCAYRLQYKYTL